MGTTYIYCVTIAATRTVLHRGTPGNRECKLVRPCFVWGRLMPRDTVGSTVVPHVVIGTTVYYDGAKYVL